MPKHTHTTRYAAYVRAAFVVCLALAAGCQTGPRRTDNELAVRGAIEHYRAERADQLVQTTAAATCNLPDSKDRFEHTILTLGTFARDDPPATQAATTQSTAAAAAARPAPPDGYWRQDLWHQMGHEALELGGHDFWHGYKTTFWNLPNVLALTGTMGASLAIQGTGVDATVRERTKGHSTLGHMSEPLQILGHPATHFAATGVLWLGSTLTQDMREHEVAKALTQALAVNGVTTLMLKAAANTRSPDNEHFGWPSGHTSSAFTVAAVLNEYYGPWVGVPSLAVAGLVGYQRVDSRVHDFSDVVFGAMLGYVIGTSIARDDKAQFPELFGMTVIPYVNPESNATGLALLKQW